jgi:hypothetical protein
MIKWRHPSSAPKDTSYFCGVNALGDITGWCFDREHNRWQVWAVPGFAEHICMTTSTLVGWARWNEVIDHIRDTAHLSNGDRT